MSNIRLREALSAATVRSARLLASKLFHTLLLVAWILYASRSLSVQYIDHDTVLYALIGEGIYKYGVFPYGYAFDHKPFVLYFIYGIISLFESTANLFGILGIISVGLTSYIAYTFFLNRTLPFPIVFFVMALATYRTVGYTGNTEVLYVLFQFSAIAALISSVSMRGVVVSAFLTAICININYISALSLIPTLTIMMLFTSKIRTPYASFVLFSFSLIFFVLVLFAAFAFAGGDIGNYFAMQRDFLLGYGSGRNPVVPRFIWMTAIPICLSGLLLVPGVSRSKEFDKIFVPLFALMIFSAISFIANGKYYLHYAYAITAPAAVIVLSLNYERVRYRAALVWLLSLVAVLYLANFVRKPPAASVDLRKVYAPISEMVGGQKVLSMRASVVPLYFSGAYPYQPLVFQDQAAFFYGSGEDAYYKRMLDGQPMFVLTAFDWCQAEGAGWQSCAEVANGYDKVLAYDAEWDRNYDLYRRKPPI